MIESWSVLEKRGFFFFSFKVEIHHMAVSFQNTCFHFPYLQVVTCLMTLPPKFSSFCSTGNPSDAFRTATHLSSSQSPLSPAACRAISETAKQTVLQKPPAFHCQPRGAGGPCRDSAGALSAQCNAHPWQPLCALLQCPPRPLLSLNCQSAWAKTPGQTNFGKWEYSSADLHLVACQI